MRSILDLDAKDAKKFFLKNESYCNIDLPSYFDFGKLLNSISNKLGDKSLESYYANKNKRPAYFDDVNHIIVGNKDGKYTWRSFSLINPILYVTLVQLIARNKNWEIIKEHLSSLKNSKIVCLSIPVVTQNWKKKDRAEQILKWWLEGEQKSLELALEYEHIIKADIANCYDSIYTHSIAWALHGKEKSKKAVREKKEKSLLGGEIDILIRQMQYGQTNGIPTGSVLMDLLAEIVLVAIDKMLSERLHEKDIKDYMILRYRDDYRIFVNDSLVGNRILKVLSEELYKFNFRLNTMKTKGSANVILSSIKEDKIAFMETQTKYKNALEELLMIYKFSRSFPNSGALIKWLNLLYDKIQGSQEDIKKENVLILISISVQIMFENPRVIPQCVGLISLFFRNVRKSKIKKIIEKITRKFNKIPNTGLLDIWLQRLIYNIFPDYQHNEPLCKIVQRQGSEKIWNFEWLNRRSTLSRIVDETDIINRDILNKITNVVPKREFDLFAYY